MEAVKQSKTTLMTSGPIWKNIIMFALPVLCGNLFQQLYNTADSLIVGNFLGQEELAAVASSGNLIFLMVGFFSGISVGAGVVISRYYGARELDKVKRAIATTLCFGVFAGVVLMILGVLCTPVLLRWMDTPENVLPKSIAYFRTYFFGALGFVMYNASTGILQATGDSKHPLYYLIVSSIINVVLDLLFVGVFRWGVESAAFATAISQFVSAGLCLHRLFTVETDYRVTPKEISLDLKMLQQIVVQGLPSGLQNSIIAIANVVVQSNINHFGDMAMAGCGSYSKIEGFGFLPITCFAMSLTTFIGQNLGAGKLERAKQGARFGVICSVIMAEVVGILIYIFAPILLSAFQRDPQVVAFGVAQARTVTLFYFLLAFSHCIAAIMRGAGKAMVPMVVMLCCWCVIRISYIETITHFIPKIMVIFWAYPLTWTLSSIIFLIYFLKGDWIHGKID